MNRSSPLNEVTRQHGALLCRLTEVMVKAAPLQRLYLIGLRTTTHRAETPFALLPDYTQVTHAYLLAVVAKEDNHGLNAVQDKLENNGQHLVPVTVIVLSKPQFHYWLSEGNPFAVKVVGEGQLLHQEAEELPPEWGIVDVKTVAGENACLLKQAKDLVQAFLAGAELYNLRQQYGLALFMLHQAAEQALRTCLLQRTGLKVNTHNLDKLLRYNSLSDAGLLEKFRGVKAEDRRLFGLLQTAYVESRYGGKSFSVRRCDVQTIGEWVEQLGLSCFRFFVPLICTLLVQ